MYRPADKSFDVSLPLTIRHESPTALPNLQDHTQPNPMLRKDDPEFDFYNDSKSFVTLMYTVFFAVAGISGAFLAFLQSENMAPSEILQFLNGGGTFLVFACLFMCILCSLSIEQHMPKARAGRIVVRTLCALTAAMAFATAVVFSSIFSLIPTASYFLLLMVEFFLSRRPSAVTPLP